MPVQLKRVGGKPVGPAARAEEDAAEESAGPSVVELREMALAQFRELRARTIADLLRLGKGLRIVTERELSWEDPDWNADPETWPPMAKCLWLFMHAQAAASQAQYLSHMRSQPGWCARCHEGEERPAWSRAFYICPDHEPVSVLQAAAHALFIDIIDPVAAEKE